MVAEEAKLDYELLDRWVKFLAKPPKLYPFLAGWQKMIQSGGTEAEAKKLAVDFQARLADVMFAAKDIEKENEIIDLPGFRGTPSPPACWSFAAALDGMRDYIALRNMRLIYVLQIAVLSASLRSFELGYRGDAEIFIDVSKILEARIVKTRSSPPPAGPSDRVCENEAGVMSSKTS
jgi:hypothetical protein